VGALNYSPQSEHFRFSIFDCIGLEVEI